MLFVSIYGNMMVPCWPRVPALAPPDTILCLLLRSYKIVCKVQLTVLSQKNVKYRRQKIADND